jgi:hypothetical protein
LEELSGGEGFGEDPGEGFVAIAKDLNSFFALEFAKDPIHPRYAIVYVARGQDRAARMGGEYGALCEPFDLFSGEVQFGDLGKIDKLREAGVKVRMLPQSLLMS